MAKIIFGDSAHLSRNSDCSSGADGPPSCGKSLNRSSRETCRQPFASAFYWIRENEFAERAAIRAHFQNTHEPLEIRWGEHCEAFRPLMTGLETAFATENHPLTSELRSHLQEGDLNPIWTLTFFLRASLDEKPINPEEVDLFDHAISPEIMRGLRRDGSWKSSLKTLLSIRSSRTEEDESFTNNVLKNLHHSVTDKIEEELAKTFPLHVPCPMWGEGKFGVSFLISSMLNGAFPMGIPSEPLDAHGTTLSRTGFVVHDWLHQMVDPSMRRVGRHVLARAEAHFLNDGDVTSFIESYAPRAVQRHNALRDAFLEIYGDFLGKLLPRDGQTPYNTIMAGWFLNLHEYPGGDPTLYEQYELAGIIEHMALDTVESISSQTAWESEHDPLQTSPLDGKSALSEDKIKAYARKRFLESKSSLPHAYYANYPYPDRETYLRDLISKETITATNRFIDVEITSRTGYKQRISFPTLYHKVMNIKDSLSFLWMGGIDFPMPDFAAAENPRKLAQQSLAAVKGHLIDLVEHFRDRAIFFANLPKRKGKSLADRYRETVRRFNAADRAQFPAKPAAPTI